MVDDWLFTYRLNEPITSFEPVTIDKTIVFRVLSCCIGATVEGGRNRATDSNQVVRSKCSSVPKRKRLLLQGESR